MAKKFRYKHINSAIEDKVPSVMFDGEIAVNRFAGKEKLFIKNANQEVVAFIPDHTIEDNINSAVSGKTDSSAFTAHTEDTSLHFNGNEKANLDSLATNIAAISGITSTKVSNWDDANSKKHTHSNKSALDSITGNVGTMAYENKTSYSSATEVSTALSGKVDVDEYDDDSMAIAIALNDLNAIKLDASAYTPTDLSNYYTKSETSGATEISTALDGKVNTETFTAHTADTSIHFTSGDVQAQISSYTYDKSEIDDKTTILMADTNGHAYVDLGLPSGTLWAKCNVGASSETDYGNYYQYGKGADDYSVTSRQSNYAGTEDPLAASADTAAQVWGGSWHMPTRAQMQELTANTTYQWVTNYKGSGINGGTFTATNGAVLFFPAAGSCDIDELSGVGNSGYYLGSSPDGSYDAYDFSFENGYRGVSGYDRGMGCSVRPVINGTVSPIKDAVSDNIEQIKSLNDNINDLNSQSETIAAALVYLNNKIGDVEIQLSQI